MSYAKVWERDVCDEDNIDARANRWIKYTQPIRVHHRLGTIASMSRTWNKNELFSLSMGLSSCGSICHLRVNWFAPLVIVLAIELNHLLTICHLEKSTPHKKTSWRWCKNIWLNIESSSNGRWLFECTKHQHSGDQNPMSCHVHFHICHIQDWMTCVYLIWS
jgi:hypothetical protein